jgi:glutathione peroxidase
MSIYDLKVKRMNGELRELKEYKGKTVLIVNTASKCGFTKQFEGLEELYKKYKEKDFTILGFPCNQFLRQDPGSDKDILEFCTLNFGVSFEMFSKINVKGKEIDPLFDFLVKNNPTTPGKKDKWNFEKFLIGADGEIVKRYQSKDKPEDIENDIVKEIEKGTT